MTSRKMHTFVYMSLAPSLFGLFSSSPTNQVLPRRARSFPIITVLDVSHSIITQGTMAEFDIQVNAGSSEVEAFLRSLNVDLPCGTTAKDWPERQQMAEPARSGGAASQAQPGNADGRLLRLMETLSAEMSSMKAQVANLASRMDAQDSGNTQPPSQPPPSEQGTGQPTPEVRNTEPPRAVTPLTTTCWADSDPEAPLGELGPVSFPDDLADMRDQASESGDSEKTRVVPVSEHTATFLKKAFTSRASNATRRKWRRGLIIHCV